MTNSYLFWFSIKAHPCNIEGDLSEESSTSATEKALKPILIPSANDCFPNIIK